jgi:aryl-alcohol dehydrogenase-like predicted oxidoreductase
MGLGCGGHSRLGQSQGKSEAESIQVVQKAIELGVNFIDTAESYRTESIVGRAIQGVPRDRMILSTKLGLHSDDRRSTPAEFQQRLNTCLERLQTDFVDILHLHGVSTDDYPFAVKEIVPLMQDLKSKGVIRAIGITEAFGHDTGHQMLSRAVQDDFWDVVMVGFNVLNQSARQRVLAKTREKNIGTLCMFAVRHALSQPEALKAVVQKLIEEGQIDPSQVDANDPLGFLLADGVAKSIAEAAYRYCAWEPGMDVILSGTGDFGHLVENAESINGKPLPEEASRRLGAIFERVDSVSGN